MFHPPYLPNLALNGIFPLFVSPNEKKKIHQRKRFADVEEVKQKLAEALKGTQINKFKNCFEQWKKCLNRCNSSNR